MPGGEKIHRPGIKWGLAGGALASVIGFMAWLSTRFDYDNTLSQEPVIALVVTMMAAGAIYFFVAIKFNREILNSRQLVFIVAMGLAFRLAMFGTESMLEDDYYRYLWDGGVCANGFNPYKYSPEDALSEAPVDFPEAIRKLAKDSDPVASRVNHPRFRTIYPPVAQAAFVAAHFIKPWSMNAWRSVLLGFDIATLVLLIVVLRTLKLPGAYIIVYWWNPLLIKDIYNSGHMDLLIFPFVLAALFLAVKKRYVWAAGALALAVGVKVWPIMLLPIVLRPLLKKPAQLALASSLFGMLTLVMFIPILAGGLDSASGFNAYGNSWEINDSMFMLVLWSVNFICGLLGSEQGELYTRLLVGIALSASILWVVRNDTRDTKRIADRFLFVVAAIFLISPTQFSWYSLWMLPLLAVRPRASLLLITVLVPMYNLRFYFKSIDMVDIHDMGIVWIEFVPVWILLVWEWHKSRAARATDPEAVGA